MSLNIPTSLYGVLGFMILALFLILNVISADQSAINTKVRNNMDESFNNIRNLQTNQSTEPGITGAATMLYNVIILMFSYIWLPFIFLVDLLNSWTILPQDLLVPVSLLFLVGFFSSIILLIRGLKAT